VTGKRISGFGLRIADLKRGAPSFALSPRAHSSKDEGRASSNPQSEIRNPHSSGFTLLELMIVISILVILALIAMAQYNKTVQAAKEATLREDLFTMRKMIDQYAADKGKLPQSLDDLKDAGYIHDIPDDPMTEFVGNDWDVENGDDPGSNDNSQGVVNVHSSSGDMDAAGDKPYNQW
jgi:general secretion pathway protein G